jgi:hypothetical protein
MSTNYDNYNGWRSEDEPQDFENFAQLCDSGMCCGKIREWDDVKFELLSHAITPVKTNVREAVKVLHAAGKSNYTNYEFGAQETNDCCAWGTSNAIDMTMAAQALRGKETTIFRTHKAWVYGIGKYLVGQRRDNGMSISLAMQHVTKYGVLPQDIDGLPKYSGELQKSLLRNGKAFFEKWKDQAVIFDIEVVRMPLDYHAWFIASAAGRNIVYGTTVKLAKNKTTGDWVVSGTTNHCRTAGYPVRADGGITDTNSWNDGSGFMSKQTAEKVIAGSSNYGAYMIYSIARRNSKPDFSGLGRN